MNIMENKYRSNEAREAYRKLRVQRNQARAASAADPIPTAVIADIVDTDGMLNGPVIKAQGMNLNVPIWQNTGEMTGDDQILKLFIAPGHVDDPEDPSFGEPVSTIPLTYPFAPTWVGDYNIPLNKIQPNGPFTFKHEVVLHTTQPVKSAVVKVISDIIAPYEMAVPAAPALMTLNTTQLDDDNIDSVLATIPDYTDKAPGDKFVYWYVNDPLPENPTTLPPVAPPAEVPPNRTVTIPRPYIEGKGDGVFYVLYVLIDKALNVSNDSFPKRFIVTLGALPTQLKKPEVPVAAGGAVIDLDTVAGGVIVEIKPYTGWKLGDKIVAVWGGIALPITYARENETTEISVPAQILLNAWKNAAGTGEKLIEVGYSVDRLGRAFGPEKDSFKVNFEVIGPPRPDPDPDFPDPTNPLLLAGDAIGSTGNNILVEADADKDFDFEFKIYTPVKAGELVQFFWEGTHVIEADLRITTETPGSTKRVSIPWKYVAATDNGPGKKMYYTIGDSAVTPNRQKSVERDVNVADAIVIKPDEPTFPDIRNGRWLICDSLQPPESAIVVKVGDLSKWLNPGDKVKMSWQLFENRIGSTPITGTLLEPELTLGNVGDEYPVTGFEWRVQPYADHIAPAYNPPKHTDANAIVTYSFTLNGKTVTSKQANPWLGMYLAGSACVITPAP